MIIFQKLNPVLTMVFSLLAIVFVLTMLAIWQWDVRWFLTALVFGVISVFAWSAAEDAHVYSKKLMTMDQESKEQQEVIRKLMDQNNKNGLNEYITDL